MVDGRPFVLTFQSAYASTATINEVGYSIPFKGFLVRRISDLQNYGYFNTKQLYNSRNSTAGLDSGPLTGYRVYIGFAGGHGIYSTSQGVCSWASTNSGAFGAGYDGSTCGSYPDGLRWGTGNNSTSTYDNRSGTWQHSLWWD